MMSITSPEPRIHLRIPKNTDPKRLPTRANTKSRSHNPQTPRQTTSTLGFGQQFPLDFPGRRGHNDAANGWRFRRSRPIRRRDDFRGMGNEDFRAPMCRSEEQAGKAHSVEVAE